MESLSAELEEQQLWDLEISSDHQPELEDDLLKCFSGDSVSTCDSENYADIRTNSVYMTDAMFEEGPLPLLALKRQNAVVGKHNLVEPRVTEFGGNTYML